MKILISTMIVLLFTACSSKVGIKTFKDGKVDSKYLTNVKVMSIKNDTIGLKNSLSNELLIQNTFKNKKAEPSYILSKIDSLSSKYKMFTKEMLNSNVCLNYKTVGNKKTCTNYQIINIRCKKTTYNLSIKFTVLNKNSINLFTHTYEKDKAYEECENNLKFNPSVATVYRELANKIAKTFISDIVAKEVTFYIEVIENADVKMDENQKKNFELGVKYIKINTNYSIVTAKDIFNELIKNTNQESYALLFNLGIINEILHFNNDALNLYKRSLKIARTKNYKKIENIFEAIKRVQDVNK